MIIFEPEKFTKDLSKIEGHTVVSDSIHYYNYEYNTIQMYAFLSSGFEEYNKNSEMCVTYNNRYRHLLCKDTAFAIQQEYRFIILDQLIDNAAFYHINFSSKYLIVPITELYNQIPFPEN